MSILSLLVAKSVKVLTRKKSFATLTVGSSVLTLGLLTLVWYMSRHQQLRFLTSDGYQHLQFKMDCGVDKTRTDHKLVCKPDSATPDGSTRGLTPSQALYSAIDTGYILTESEEASQLAVLLSSVMMNGLPLLGLDDFVYFSDFIGEEMGKDAKAALLTSPGYKHKFSNFLRVRRNKILLYPDSCWTRQFVAYMSASTKTFSQLTVRVVRDQREALRHCCHNVWVILEIHTPAIQGVHGAHAKQDCSVFEPGHYWNRTTSPSFGPGSPGPVPEITLRMHPASVPDTRNYEYSPLNRHLLSRQQSGQLLYFTSGFLTLQLEVQNFLAYAGLGGSIVRSDVFSGHNAEILLQPALAAHDLAQRLAAAQTPEQLQETVRNATAVGAGLRPSLAFPLFHRAFPTHNNHQSLFWHSFGALTSIGLILYFSIPAAIVAGEFSRERASGQLDVLSTLPGVSLMHSIAAWCVTVGLWVAGCAALVVLFFCAVLQHSVVLMPSITLLLLGLSLGPLAMMVSLFTKSAEAVVVAVPTLVFITLLPGLLYFELAFDMQRSVPLELALCLLPPSAAALILRTLCGYEALNAGTSWYTRAAISNCPMYAYLVMLAVDLVLYSAIAVQVGSRWDISHQRVVQDKLQRAEYERRRSCGAWICEMLQCWWEHVCWCCCGCCGCWTRTRTSAEAHAGSGLRPHNTEADIELQGLLQAQSASPTAHRSGGGREYRITLKVRNLTKRYAMDASEVVVLSDINANLYEHRVTVLLGSNGAGKTTFMRILAGLDCDYEGRVRLSSAHTGSAYHLDMAARGGKRHIGWCPQNDALFEHLTVLEHLQLVSCLVQGVSYPPFTSLLPTRIGMWIRRVSCWGTSSATSRRSQQQLQLEEGIVEALKRLDMLRHCNKRVSELSGGMKRRLSLCLAFLGDPAVLLLDEPTSGCDAHTRELVRQDILSRRGGSAILISTHHTDDVDVLADRVWFLSERYLEVDEAVENLAAWRSRELKRRRDASISAHSRASTPSPGADVSMQSTESLAGLLRAESVVFAPSCSGAHAMEFSTHDEQVKEAFRSAMGASRAATWLSTAGSRLEPPHNNRGSRSPGSGVTATPTSTCAVWMVPVDALPLLRKLLSRLERSGLHSWSVATCSTYSMLCHLYELPATQQVPLLLRGGARQVPDSPISVPHASLTGGTKELGVVTFVRHCYAVAWMRYWEARYSLCTFLLTQVLLPFLVVFTIAWSCQDVVYPKTELTSNEIGGLGEMCAAQGVGGKGGANPYGELDGKGPRRPGLPRRKPADTSNGLEPQQSLLSAESPLPASVTNRTDAALQADLASRFGEDTVLWQAFDSSDQLWQSLFDSYYAHEQPRWAAFVVDDVVQRWVESTVVLDQGSLRVDLSSALEAIRRAQSSVCNGTTTSDNPDADQAGAGGHNHDHQRELGPSTFCGQLPALRIEFLNHTANYQNGSIAITSYESARTNVTLLSNVTTDHAAPIFLKEVVPVVYSALQQSGRPNHLGQGDGIPDFIASSYPYAASYRLYSHPLPMVNDASEVYLQRGYVGSTVVLLYALLTTVVCVRSVIAQRRGGTKNQLHLAGVFPLSFWLGNYLADTLLCSVTFAAIFIGIAAGGAPISNFFMDFPPLPGLLLAQCLLSFAAAAVASSYAFSVLSQDTLSSQLLLLVSAVANGMFLKLFLDRRLEQRVYGTVAQILLHVSPAFTFSTAIGDLIAMHALQVSAAARGKAGPGPEHLLRSVNHCVVIMAVQAAAYLVLCALVDYCWTALSAAWARCWWAWRKRFDSTLYTSVVVAPSPVLARPQSAEEEGLGTGLGEVPLVEALDVMVKYPRLNKLSLNRASFRIRHGERVALLGMNGGGKSTLFRTLVMAENAPISGRVAIDGLDAVFSMWRLCGRGAVGYVPQEGGLFEFLTVEQTLRLCELLNHPGHARVESYRSLLSSEGDIIPERYSGYPVHTLSGGTRKKLSVRVANAGQPSLLLLDECTTGVDPVAAERIVRYLKEDVGAATQGILFASHRIDESLAVCDRVILLCEGQVVLDEPIRALHDLAHRFFHLDVTLGVQSVEPPVLQVEARGSGTVASVRNYGSLPSPGDQARALDASVIEGMTMLLADLQRALGAAERVVRYTPTLARITWARSKVPLSPVWELLARWQESGRIRGYAFRSAAMEEVLQGTRTPLSEEHW